MGKMFDIEKNVEACILKDSETISIRKLAEKYSFNKNVILRILNAEKRKKDGIENIEFLCCKKTNKIFYDVRNKSGILTKHLKEIYGNSITLRTINDYSKYFNIEYNNKNYISFHKYLITLRLIYENKPMFNGLYKYYFSTKNVYVFFIENKKISNNKKIKPILFSKLKDRYHNSIFIYEDEWEFSSNIIKRKIETILNISKLPRLFGRNCEIRSINSKEKTNFLNSNHIQGSANSTINFGAYYNNELVAVMTFTTNRNMTNDIIKFDYELNRFATKINYRVVGIGGKLFKHFLTTINKNATIISYGDRRFVLNSQTNFYRKIGFKLNQVSKHDYSYMEKNSIKRIHKITIQIKTKKNKNEDMDYEKIWDCGKYRFLYKYE